MKLMIRKASVQWTDGFRGGSGSMTTDSGALNQAPYSAGARFKKPNGTTPAELIAAAHAGSFSMALANELKLAGFVPDQIAILATVTLELLAAGWTITNINLKVLAKVPKATQGDFIDATLRAKTGCPVSRLLRVNISMNAKLESNTFAPSQPQPPKRKPNPPVSKKQIRSRKPRRPPHF